MARTPNENELPLHELNTAQEKNVDEMVEAERRLAAFNHQISDNVQQLAKQLDYDGLLTVGGLEDEIRVYQRRTAEACVELGKRLLLLKEMTPRGEFSERVSLLGFSRSSAYRFMQAAKKFSNRPNLGRLSINKESAGKFLELLVLDDDEIDVLESGESLLGITLDSIDCMSASELRKALREAREQAKQVAETKDLIIQKKDQKINQLDEELARYEVKRRSMPEAAKGEAELGYLNDETLAITSKITASLNSRITQLFDAFGGDEPAHVRLAAAQSIGLIITAAYALAADFGLQPETKAEEAADDPARREAAKLEAMMDADADPFALLDDEAKADLKRLNSYKQVDIED